MLLFSVLKIEPWASCMLSTYFTLSYIPILSMCFLEALQLGHYIVQNTGLPCLYVTKQVSVSLHICACRPGSSAVLWGFFFSSVHTPREWPPNSELIDLGKTRCQNFKKLPWLF
jgi:hypothetical protein